MRCDEQCCGNCAYHEPPVKHDKQLGWTCDNKESELYGLTTEYGDSCDEYSEDRD